MKETTRFKQTVVTRAVIAALCGTASMMAAQETLAQAQPSQSLQRVEVTGSNIKRTDSETASPVQVMTREDIEKSGKQSIQEVLRSVTADNQGSIPSSFSNGFASGSAAISLRGLGVNSTLVLVNGRRMTTYGLADDGTRNFVDLNSLPLEAVERIEILKDGASAIYGADAVGGVVNVILRKNYTGRSIGGSFGISEKGDGQTTRVFGSAGFGNIDTDKYNVFFTLEATQQDNIWARDRGYIGRTNLTDLNFYNLTNGEPRPYFGLASPSGSSPYGIIRDPVTNARVNVAPCDPSLKTSLGLCGYNSRLESEIQPHTDRLNLFGRGTMEFSPTMTGYAELGIFNTVTKANGTLGGNSGDVVFSGDPFNPAIFHGAMTLPASHPDNPYGVDRALTIAPNDLGGRDIKLDNTVTRIIAGLQGSAWGWDYDTGIGYIHSRLEQTRTGYIDYNAMQTALNNGTYRLVGLGPTQTSAAVLNSFSYPLQTTSTSSVKLIDFKATRELMNLGGGPLAVAVGAERRWEDSDSPDVPGTSNGTIVGLGFAQFKASRSVTAFYGEVNAPVTKWLELNGALRHDRYSDFGSATTPKVGFKLKPFDQLAIRGTYAEAFRAPGPAETGGNSFGFTSVAILSLGNPNIQPEEAKSYTLGLVVEPFPGTSATIDWWRVKKDKEILQADPASIITPAIPDTGAPFTRIAGATPGSFVYYGADGNIAAVSGVYQNAASSKTQGVDFELRHRMNLGSNGKLTAQLNWTHLNKREVTDAFGNTFEYSGTHGPLVQSSGSGTPKDRISASLTWDRGPWAVTAMVNYVGPIKLIDHNGEVATDNGDGTVTDQGGALVWNWDGVSSLNCGAYTLTGQNYNGNCKLPSFTTVDLYARWSPMKNLDVNFSIQNVFDKKAPFDPYLAISYANNYNQGFHQSGAVGRFFTIGARYSF